MRSVLFLWLTLLAGSASAQIDSLHFIGEYDVAFNAPFRHSTIGGLSGIDYDSARNVYYLISDDRSEFNPARFYTAAIPFTDKGIDSVRFTEVTTLLGADGKPYPNAKQDAAHTPDPEALRYDRYTDRMVWSSEGERIVTPAKVVLEDPAVTLITRDGRYVDTFALPPQLHMHTTPLGPRQNGVFEGVAFADQGRDLYVSVEEPLYQDGPRAALQDTVTWDRIIRYDTRTRLPVAQYAYHLGPVVRAPVPAGGFMINGIPDIMDLGNQQLLVMERSFSVGNMACTIRLYVVDLSRAADISAVASLRETPPASPVAKRPLLDMDRLGRYVDNIEGVTFGPPLPNGHKTLLFVADNNFNPLQRTQFFLFEVYP
jgi:hypothetical protein